MNIPFDGGGPGFPITRGSREEQLRAAVTVREIGGRLEPGTDAADVVLAMLGLDDMEAAS